MAIPLFASTHADPRMPHVVGLAAGLFGIGESGSDDPRAEICLAAEQGNRATASAGFLKDRGIPARVDSDRHQGHGGTGKATWL